MIGTKGGLAMTDVLNVYNIQELVCKEEKKKTRNEKINSILQVIKIKKSEEVEEIIKENIICDKKIRNGRATIKGTRITPKELILATSEVNIDDATFEKIRDYLYEQYPSITKESEIEAAIYYVLKYDINLFKYIIVTFIAK